MDLNLAKLRKEARVFRLKNKRLTHRIQALIELSKRSQNGALKDRDYELVAIFMEVSKRTLYRWAKLYRAGGAGALAPTLTKGRKPQNISGWTALHIKEMRLSYLWGAEVIQAHLLHDYNIELSQWKIHKLLKDRGYVARKKRRKKKNTHTRVVKVLQPGAHTQIDVKHLPHILRNGKKCYVFNFVDHASKWQFKMAFEGCGVWETHRFMLALLDVVPFTIRRLQTDNGTEFSYRHLHFFNLDSHTIHPLEHICKLHKIRKVLIPPGVKELNGLVERSHRMDDEELYQTIRPINIFSFNRKLHEHTKWLNNFRRRKSLSWQTANNYLKNWNKEAEQEDIKIAA